MADTITARVFRYDPSTDEAPYYKEYEVPYDGGDEGFMTGLQVLHYIYDNIEPVAFDYDCRGSLCGRCSMVIDGKAGLACYTPLQPGEHTFEPLGDMPVLRDLVVDRAAFIERFVDSRLAKETVEPVVKSEDIDYDLYWNKLERLNNCRECMCCYEACPALQERGQWDFVGPGAMAQIAFRHLDPHDQGDRLGQAVESGLWRCDLCGACTAVCPAQIPHVEIFSQLQADAEAAGLRPTMTADEAFEAARAEVGAALAAQQQAAQQQAGAGA